MITNKELIAMARAVQAAREERVAIQRKWEMAKAIEEDASRTFENALAVVSVERQFNESEECRFALDILARARE
jgi:hypothetical protein